jgi:phage terminase small subunit
MAINRRQEAFCKELLKGVTQTQAYCTAYNVKDSLYARNSASRLMANESILNFLEEKRAVLNEKLELKASDVLNELKKIGFSDVRKLYNKDGSLKQVSELDDDTAAAVAGVEELTNNKYNDFDKTKKIKMADKTKALDLLGRHLGLFTDKKEIELSGEVNLKTVLVKFVGDDDK